MDDVLMSNSGKGLELRELLGRELGLPPNTRSFDVHFADGEPLLVRCEYHPASGESDLDDLPAINNLGRSLDDR